MDLLKTKNYSEKTSATVSDSNGKIALLPVAAIEEFEKFKAWHFEYSQSLNALNLQGEAETEYLNKILPDTRTYYFTTIEKIGNLCKDITEPQKKLFFNYIAESGLHNLIKSSPYFFHSIFKPRGYAGDAEMMALIYRNTFEGNDSFSKLIHRIGTDCAACVAIRNRKNLLHHSFAEFRNGKVLSLAAGPAEEIYEYMSNRNSIDFLALDHDIETLKTANSRNQKLRYGIANAFRLIKNDVKYLIPRKSQLANCNPKADTKGIRQLLLPLKYSINKLQKEEFDLIYSAGLFDYIKTFDDPHKGTVALTRKLFDLLKPGGRMLIGNVSPKMPVGIVWSMECLCDWYLIYRTKQEVLDFAQSIPKNQIASIEVIAEETGINWFLDIRKK